MLCRDKFGEFGKSSEICQTKPSTINNLLTSLFICQTFLAKCLSIHFCQTLSLKPSHYMVLYTNIQFLMCTWFVNCQHKYCTLKLSWKLCCTYIISTSYADVYIIHTHPLTFSIMWSVSITWSHLVTLHVFCLASHHQESWPSMLWSLCHNQLIEFPVVVPTVMWCVIMIISLYNYHYHDELNILLTRTTIILMWYISHFIFSTKHFKLHGYSEA